MNAEREMSLLEWCQELPSFHRVNKELKTLLAGEDLGRIEAAIKHLDEEAERFFAKAGQHGIEGNYDRALEAKKAGTDCKLDADLLRWSLGQKQNAFSDDDFGLDEEK